MRCRDSLRAVGLASMLMAGTGSFLSTARAQAVVVASTPADGATLTMPPALELRFNTQLDKRASHLLLARADGSTQTLTDHAASAWVIRCTLAQDLIPGPYLLRYQVRDGAGHTTRGVLRFTLMARADGPR
ncbi:MAG: copper resistance protein CopC [Gammaproteobacteria bacterium]|nr:copper resistance protein CopC [Gammaproteobacteria bacterium]